MKRLMLVLLVLASSLALTLEINGTYCGEQMIHGTLYNDFSYQVIVNSTASKIRVGGADFCLAPEKGVLEAGSMLMLFSKVERYLPNETYFGASVPTSAESVVSDGYLNFTECSCTIGFPTGIQVTYSPPTSDVDPGKIKIVGAFEQCGDVPSLIAVLTIDDACAEVGSIVPTGPFAYISSRSYSPSEAKRMKVKVFAWEPLGDAFGMASRSRVDFSAFSVTTEPGPAAKQGESTWVSVKVKNEGTLSDQYTITLGVPETWSAGEVITRTLLPDETVVSNITIALPADFKGVQQIEVHVTPDSAIDPATVLATVETEKIILIKTIVDVPPRIDVGKNFTMDVIITSTSTHASELYYYVYTEPASRIKPLIGRLELDADDQTRLTLDGEIFESCGVDTEGTEDFALLEDIRALKTLLEEELVSEVPREDVVRMVREAFSKLLMKLVNTKVYEPVSQIQQRTQTFLADYGAGKDVTKTREAILIQLQGLKDKIDISEADILKNCAPTDQFKVKLVLKRIPTLQTFYGEDVSKVSIEDVFRVELSRSELRMQPGKEGTLTLIVYNVGQTRRDFEIISRNPTTTEWVEKLRSFSLDPGYSKSVALTIRPPKMLSGEFKIDLVVQSPPYSVSRTIPLFLGKYGVQLTAPDISKLDTSRAEQGFIVLKNLGDTEDVYKISVDGESWVDYESNATVPGKGEYKANITFTPPMSVSGKFTFKVTATSLNSPEISESIQFKVEVSSKQGELQSEISSLKQQLTSLQEKYGTSEALLNILKILNAAETSAAGGDFTQSSSKILQVRKLISEFKANPPQQESPILYVLVLVVPVGGYFLYTSFSKKKEAATVKLDSGYMPLPPQQGSPLQRMRGF